MSEPEVIVAEAGETTDSKAERAELQRQVQLLLIVVTLVSCMFAAFLGLQYIRASRDLDAIRQKGIQISEALKRQEAGLEAVKARLIEFGQSHADFAPILIKYGLKPASGPAAAQPAPPAQTAPPAASPKK